MIPPQPPGYREIPDLEAEAARLAETRSRPVPKPLAKGDVVQVTLADGTPVTARIAAILITADAVMVTAVRGGG